MKKTLSLILALVLCLSLCACGGGKTSDVAKNASNADFYKIYDVAKNALNADFHKIYKDCQNNITAAKDKYVGNTYKFAGIVKGIDEDSVSIAPIKFPTGFSTWYQVEVFMSKDDIKKVSTNQIVNVAGEISDISNNANVQMKNGVLIDDVIEFEGEVTNFILNESYTKHLMVIEAKNAAQDYTGMYKKITYHCEVCAADEFENIDEANINGVIFTKGNRVKGTAKMRADGAYSDRFIVYEIVSIEKN